MAIFSNILSTFNSPPHPVELKGQINCNKIPQTEKERGIHVFTNSWLAGKKYVGTAILDPLNRFKVNYTAPSSFFKTHNVSLEIFEKERPFASQGLRGYCELKPLGKASIQLGNQIDQSTTISDEQIKSLTTINKPTGINRPSISYFARLLMAGGPEIIKTTIVNLFSYWMTAEKAQKIFNSFGPQYQRSEPTLANLADDLLNSICAVDYKDEGGKIVWEANWDNYEFDREGSLPNVTVSARKENDAIIIESIRVKFRGEEEQIILPEQSSADELKWGIYMARSVFALKGESEIHLAEGHLLPGIIGEAFLSSISKENPLYNLIARYLQNLEFINWLGGNGIIFGEGSVIELSALTDKSVARLIIRFMKEKANYMDYIPKEPIAKNHHRAIAGKVHYDALFDYFSTYINDNWDTIVPFKDEIFKWSESINQKLSAIPKIIPDPNHFTKEEEGQRLAKCLTSLVNQTTFLHWSSHSRQDVLAHVDLASLCLLNKGRGPDGTPVKFGNTPLVEVSTQLKLARTLLNFNAHKFVDYAQPELIAKIDKLKESYKPFRINEMFVSTEI